MNDFSPIIEIESENDYLTSIKVATNNMKKAYMDISSECVNCNQNRVKLVCSALDKTYNDIKTILSYYFKGDITKSINKTKEMIVRFKDVLKIEMKKSHAFNYHFPLGPMIDKLILYKGRISDEPFKPYGFDEMFHIPLDKRGLVKGQRYSMVGIPCVYLACNSYVVWHELGKPSFNKLNVSAFEIMNLDKRIIDLTYPYSLIFKIVKDDYICDDHLKFGDINTSFAELNVGENPFHNGEKCNYLLWASLWPLLCSVSVYCTDENRSFKVEYVIPQLIMNCLDDCVGVAYKSTQMGNSNRLPYTNLVIPITSYTNKSAYGKVKDEIRITQPLNFSFFIDVIDYGYKIEEKKSTFNIKLDYIPNANCYEKSFVYKNSKFYRYDEYLASEEFHAIK